MWLLLIAVGVTIALSARAAAAQQSDTLQEQVIVGEPSDRVLVVINFEEQPEDLYEQDDMEEFFAQMGMDLEAWKLVRGSDERSLIAVAEVRAPLQVRLGEWSALFSNLPRMRFMRFAEYSADAQREYDAN